jgi:cell wall-associated NlpC family hydrolase
MTSRLTLRPQPLLTCSLVLLSGCAQGMVSLSPSTVISAVIMAGEAVGAHTRSGGGGSSSSGNAGMRIPRSPAPSAAAARVLGTADQYIGVPYTWGGNTPESGFDCSGFTKFVFARHGIQLPRTSREQARAGQGIAVDFAALAPGDLIMFAEPGEAISHVAIYVGSGRIIHSSSALGGVNYLDLAGDRGGWYVQNMVAARRLMSNGRSLVQSLSSLTIPGLPFDPPDPAHPRR